MSAQHRQTPRGAPFVENQHQEVVLGCCALNGYAHETVVNGLMALGHIQHNQQEDHGYAATQKTDNMQECLSALTPSALTKLVIAVAHLLNEHS